MKGKQYRLARLKYQLAEKKRNKVSEVFWRLDPEQERYVTEVLHYETIPYLYRIRTRKFNTFGNVCQDSLLKELHYAKKNGKETIVRKLSRAQKKMLDEYNIKYWTEKFQINLR